jgi:prepilin-type processing-associated H-X9-DG protein
MVRASHRRGLTRVELTIVIVISITAIGLLLPAIQRARAGGGSSQCQNNLMQVALGTLSYHDTYGQFAPGMDDQYVGELIPLLPFVDQNNLYKNFSYDPAYSLYYQNPYNRPPSTGTDDIPRPPDLYGCEGEVDTYLCPDAPQPGDTVTALLTVRYGTAGVDYRAGDGLSNGHLFSSAPGRLVMARSSYLGTAGLFSDPRYRGIFAYNSQTQLSDLQRGAANTIMYGELWGGFVIWSGGGGIPDGWSNASRSVGFNFSSFGTCPDPSNQNCDFIASSGLSFGTYGALHPLKSGKFGFNVAMADGSVQTLAGDIDYTLWVNLCSVMDNGTRAVGLRPELCGALDD